MTSSISELIDEFPPKLQTKSQKKIKKISKHILEILHFFLIILMYFPALLSQ